MMYERIKNLYNKVKVLENSSDKEKYRLPSECYFLGEDEIVCYPREIGDGRYPYQRDGLTLWAHSSGNISVGESLYNVFLDSLDGKEPNIAFFVGEKQRDGSYFPVSITGVASQPIEKDVKRFTVYTPEAAYYFAEKGGLISTVVAFVDEKKRVCFAQIAENKSGKDKKIYLSAYFNPLMRHQVADDFEDKWYKQSVVTDYGYRFRVTEYLTRESCLTHYGALRRQGFGEEESMTTSRYDFTGATSASLNCSRALQTGKFAHEKSFTEFSDMAVAGEINRVKLRSGETRGAFFLMALSDDKETAEAALEIGVDLYELFENGLYAVAKRNEDKKMKELRITFDDFSEQYNGKENVLNYFIRNVINQVDTCARAKNYAGAYIGVRDVMQQLEAAIAWDPAYVRNRILDVLRFIGDDGRAPRQFSYPANDATPPKMDLRAFIDQGVWIISTVYKYLCFTGDYSLLGEMCGYYNFDGTNMADRAGQTVNFSSRRDSVLDHLIAITDYLISNLDEKTGCLHVLYGDWNDALDGLGKTDKKGKVFGTGVSVMASLQLYQNLGEIADILKHTGKATDKAKHYMRLRNELGVALIKNTVVTDGNGHKILHGWGDDRSYFVGSYSDNDGQSRDSLTANAFWILSGLVNEYDKVLPDIRAAYGRLEDKYGIKTFEPHFAPDNDKVGRIVRLPKGTAENGATYNHSTCFAVWSLFEIGEGEWAWKELYKMLPIGHNFITTTPFVMPNSYIHNEERGFDGESMSDWFTGAGCVLVKLLIGGAFGVKPSLDGLEINPSEYMPCADAQLTLKVKKAKLELTYSNEKIGSRKFYVNGKERNTLSFTNDELNGILTVEIKD